MRPELLEGESGPLLALVGPSVAQLYNSRRTKDVINKTMRLNFQPIFDEDLKKRLAKKRT